MLSLPLGVGSDLRWPELPDDALYGLVGEVVNTLLPHTEAHPAALAADFLCGFGVMAGNSVGPWPHCVADAAEHHACLNVLIVGDTARARKSTAFHQIQRLFREVDQDFMSTRVLSGFGSGEALVDDVAESPDKRLWLVEHEFSRVLVAAKREGSILSHVIRQAWDGDTLQVRTRKKKVVADQAHIAVTGHITMEELRSNLGDTGAANGFMNRFLIVAASRSKLLPTGGSLSSSEITQLARSVTKALMIADVVTTMGRTDDAEELWSKIYSEMAEDVPGGIVGAIVARSEAQVLRLSAIYALTDGSGVVSVDHVRAAWAMWSYCRASAVYVFGRGHVAETILEALTSKLDHSLSKSEIHVLLGGHITVKNIDAVLGGLEREGCIAATTTSSGRGRPETRFNLQNMSPG